MFLQFKFVIAFVLSCISAVMPAKTEQLCDKDPGEWSGLIEWKITLAETPIPACAEGYHIIDTACINDHMDATWALADLLDQAYRQSVCDCYAHNPTDAVARAACIQSAWDVYQEQLVVIWKNFFESVASDCCVPNAGT